MDIKRISPQEAAEQMKAGYVYVDVRSEPEFEAGHPAGAVNVPLAHMGPGGMAPNPDFVKVMEANFPRDAKIVLGCKAGGRSLRAGQGLMSAGYTNLLEQRAGWDGARDAFGQVSEAGWGRTELPKAEGAPAGKGYADLSKKV